MHRLKLRGAADLMIGFWTIPLEGVHTVDLKERGLFHDWPATNNMFARPCTPTSILVHRVRGERWDYVDLARCALDECPEGDHEGL